MGRGDPARTTTARGGRVRLALLVGLVGLFGATGCGSGGDGDAAAGTAEVPAPTSSAGPEFTGPVGGYQAIDSLCNDVLPRSVVEQYFGDVLEPNVVSATTCSWHVPGSYRGVWVSLVDLPALDGDLDDWQASSTSFGEPVEGVGDDAVWDPEKATLTVLAGEQAFEVEVELDERSFETKLEANGDLDKEAEKEIAVELAEQVAPAVAQRA